MASAGNGKKGGISFTFDLGAVVAAIVALAGGILLGTVGLRQREQLSPTPTIQAVRATQASATSLAMSTPYPPQPTHTPCPPQPTHTPYPHQSTYTPYPPEPTYTPYPTVTRFPTLTNTPIPPTQTPYIIIATPTPVRTPTPPKNTPPGTVLDVGKTWKQNGLYLTLTKVDLDILHGESRVELSFFVENRTGKAMSFNFDTRNVVVVDNNGTRFEKSSQYICTEPYHIEKGETFDTEFGCGSNYVYPKYYGDWFAPNVDYLLAMVSNFGRIDEAKWKVDITH